MRISIAALALLLTACAPPAPTAPSADPAAAPSTPSAANADTIALHGVLAEGAWSARADEGLFAAGFGAPQSEYQFTLTCNAPTGALTLMIGHEPAPDQATTLRLITSAQTLTLPARSEHEGLPEITAQIADDAPEKTPLISMLGAPTDRFAVDAGGAITVFPWDDAVARTLIACR